ncbi:hypothetical protein BTHE68_41210 [Burkholderia sp. THE68]|uniref:Mu transposase C-terminal domain-containing protein n=1 Tax=Burkholderia sp. THE68 TaxID=758782 RepID=UPI00131924E9|nr:Mu transposase C-terminal domain-containing protein [Burkholderia sp. THE68]BBU30387.1 hypothetical protein BTHE68_41210 [Burkholderia sp. THE68]
MGVSENAANLQEADDHVVISTIKPGTPLTDAQLQSLMRAAGVLPLGQAFIREVRKRQPDTAPKSDRECQNVTGRYVSGLMSRVMQFGSVFPELCALFVADSRLLNPGVIEFWNRIRLRGVETFDANGRRCGPVSRPMHALVLEKTNAYFLELRRVSEVQKSSHFVQAKDGTWTSPNTEAAAARYGIGYRLMLDTQIGPYLQGNLSYLSSCLLPDYRKPDEAEIKKVIQAVRENGVVRRRDLIGAGHAGEAVKCAIAQGRVFFALHEKDLTNVETAYLYSDRATYVRHQLEQKAQGALAPPPLKPLPVEKQVFTWDGKAWIVVNAGDTKYWVRRDVNGPTQEVRIDEVRDYCARGEWVYEAVTPPRVMRISDKRRTEAEALYELIGRPDSEWRWPYGPNQDVLMSTRTVSRIRCAVQKAELEGTSPIDALVRNYDNCGSRFDRVEEAEYGVWLECLKEDYLHDIKPTFGSVTRVYGSRCKEKGVTPVSGETIRRRLRRIDKAVVVLEQDGRFAAYEYGSFVPRDKINRLVKGRIPFELAHIDHTPVPVTLVCSVTGRVQTRRAWRSVMRDAATFRVLAHTIHYGVPSYETLYRLLREAVRRNEGKLPQYLVCDRALEFQAKQFHATIARYGIIKLNRPARTPRAGQPVEAGFKKDDNEILMNISGHAKYDVDFRKLLDRFKVCETARHTLTEIRDMFDKLYYEIEPMYPSSRTGHESIVDYEKRVLDNVGRSHIRMVKNDLEFNYLCMPAVPKGYRKVTDEGTIEVLTLEYHASELKDAEVKGRYVLVRYDPDNIGRVAAWVKGAWVECRSNHYDVLREFSHLERLAYQEYLTGEGEDKAKSRTARGMALGRLLRDMRTKADGKVLHGIALENAGKTYTPENQERPKVKMKVKLKPPPVASPYEDGTSDEDLGVDDDHNWTDDDIPVFASYADRV